MWFARHRSLLFGFVVLCTMCLLFVFLTHRSADAAINQEINFQGKLVNLDGTNVTNGTYSIVFSIYTVSSGGSAVWTETQPSVSVNDGIFQVALGSVTSLPGSVDFNGSSLYLGIKVGTDSEMTPRVRFTASPYAFNSSLLNGLSDTNFVKLAQGLQVDASTTNASIAINKTGGTAGILQLQRAGNDVLTISNTGVYAYTLSASDNPSYTVTNNGSGNVVTNLAGSGDVVFQDNGSAFLTIGDTGSYAFTLDATDNPAYTITNSGSSDVTTNLAGTGDFVLQDNGSAFLTINDAGAFTYTLDATDNPAYTITNSGAGNIVFNLAAGGDFSVQDNSTDVLTVNDTGNVTIAPTAGQNLSVNLAAGSSTAIAATAASTADLLSISNAGQESTTTGVDGLNLTFGSNNASGAGINVTPGFTGGATDALSYTAINVAAFSPTNAAGTDTVRGLYLGNMTDPGATITSVGVNIGTGWDYGLQFDDTTPTIRLGATDNSAILSIVDSSGNIMLRAQDHSTNFGSSFEAGAFINYNSMYVDEFFKDRAQVAADGNQNWGDNTEWSTAETGTCTWDGTADAINGITTMVANAVASSCILYHADLAAATPNLWLDADFLPTLVMKVRPSVAGAGVPDTDHQFFAGMSDGGMGAVPASGAPTNGIYFTNASNAAGTTGTANWYAVTDNGGTATNTACGVAVSETAYALLIIKVMSTSLVKFYIDPDVSNGVSLTECGTGNTANINTAGMTTFLKADWDANTNASTLDIDFYRVWQDDAPTTSPDTSDATAIREVSSALKDANIISKDTSIASIAPSLSSTSNSNTGLYVLGLAVLGVVGWLYYRQRRIQKIINRAAKRAHSLRQK